MDRRYSPQYKYKLGHDSLLYIVHLSHKFQGKDRYICFSGMLCLRDNLSELHIPVGMLRTDLQNILEYTGMLQHCFFFDIQRWIHKVMDCRDLLVQWFLVELK